MQLDLGKLEGREARESHSRTPVLVTALVCTLLWPCPLLLIAELAASDATEFVYAASVSTSCAANMDIIR
jgi:spore maturation protein SpmA